MTIKRGRWAARIPGLRWGGQQIRRDVSALLDFETRSFVGFDSGRKDESAMVIATRLPSGRLILTSIKPPTKEEADSMLKQFRMVFPLVPSRMFEQAQRAHEAAREFHKDALAAGAKWDGMDGYDFTEATGKLPDFRTPEDSS